MIRGSTDRATIMTNLICELGMHSASSWQARREARLQLSPQTQIGIIALRLIALMGKKKNKASQKPRNHRKERDVPKVEAKAAAKSKEEATLNHT